MTNAAIPTMSMQTVPKSEWPGFLAEFTRRNRGAHARLEILGGETKYQVETENRPFDGVAADLKDGEHTVWIGFSSAPDDRLTHGVTNAVKLYALRASDQPGEILAVEAGDGSKSVLYLSLPTDFALPQT